ncbi:MAG: alpha-glucosidase/alpha-galactosidase [Treponema sp.]|nr:alpha-glucosidase/alpha-galactosidase [Treponema sp.]
MKADSNTIKICYIGGGSRNWAWVLMQDLCFEKDIRGTVELYDIDLDAARHNEALGNALLAEHNPGVWKFRANSSLQNALEDSDFVFISILPGDFEEMAVDVHEPERYGIYQSVGDTVGPGGIIRAMRTIPQFQEIAWAIKKWAPGAWVLNYTNPMTVCTRTLYRVFPEIRAFGCCHEVFNTQKLLIRVLEEAGLMERDSARREDISTGVLGINHFTWIDRASYRDIDIFPYYRDFAARYAATGFLGAGAATTFAAGSAGTIAAEDPGELLRQKYFSSAERVKLDLFRRYGLIAAAGDRHLAEFCPHSWYMASPEHAESWGFALTPVSWRIENREKLRRQSRAYREGREKLRPVSSGEEGLTIMKALLGLGNLVTNVNQPNRGQMPDMPGGAVVETNAFLSRDHIQPLVCLELPGDVRALVMPQVLIQEAIVEASLARDREAAFRVFCQDLSIQSLSLKDARELFEAMCDKTLGASWGV